MRVLIDGYNLIFAWGWMPQTNSPTASQQARAKLIERLKQLIRQQDRSRVTLIFDVRGNRENSKWISTDADPSGFLIRFAYEHPDADDLIVELIRKEPAPESLVVVSSDQQIKTAAVRRKIVTINSEDFMDELPSVLQSWSGAQRSEVNLGAVKKEAKNETFRQKAIEELSGIDWMKEFGLNGGSDDLREGH